MQASTKQPYHVAIEVMAWIARILVCLLLLIAPWPYGMANWSSQVWLVPVLGGTLLLASLVAVARRISVGNPLVWSLTIVLVMGLVQIVPLPAGLWQALSPTAGFLERVDELASDFAEEGSADSSTAENAQTTAEQTALDARDPAFDTHAIVDSTISIHPLQTRTTLCVFAMGLAMLISAIILFRDRVSVAVLLGTVALSGVVVAVLGIYQAVSADEWTFLENMASTSFATFYGRNSAPQFFACGFAAAAGWLVIYHAHQTRQQEKMLDKRYRIVYPSVNMVARLRRRAEQFVTEADPITAVCALAMALLLIAVMAANSRGGILAFGASAVLVIIVYAMGRQAGWSTAVVTLLLTVGTALFLTMFGFDELIGARLDSLSEEAYTLNNARFHVWSMAFSQLSCWVLGSGLGTFHLALLPAYDVPQLVQFAHAENIYVELASNAGIVTLLIALGGLGWLLWQLLTSHSNSNTAKATRVACLFAVLAAALQNMVDFSLILPAIFLPLAALVGAYLGTRHHVRKKVRVRSNRHARSAWHDETHHHIPTRSHSSGLTERTSQPTSRHSGSTAAQSAPLGASGSGASGPPVREASEKAVTGKSPSTEKSAAEKQAAESDWAPVALIVCLLLISAAVAVGYRPLAAQAFAESLRFQARQLNVPADDETIAVLAGPTSKELLRLLDSATASPWSSYPDVHLEIGRLRQSLAQQQLLESERWPEEVTPAMRQSLSAPQFFNVAFHAVDDPELTQLREYLQANESAALENLTDSQFDMRVLLAACPMEWRGSWGLMRSDLGDISSLERRRNYARILLTCRAHLGDLQAAATHASMIGERRAGLAIWSDILPISINARLNIFRIVDRFMSLEDLVRVLPTNVLQRIDMARNARDYFQLPQASAAILETVKLDEAFEQARNAADWTLVAWCAQQKTLPKQAIKAWQQARLKDPANHLYAYYLALAYEQAGQKAEALTSIEEALDRAEDNATYVELRNRLKQTPSLAPPVSPTE